MKKVEDWLRINRRHIDYHTTNLPKVSGFVFCSEKCMTPCGPKKLKEYFKDYYMEDLRIAWYTIRNLHLPQEEEDGSAEDTYDK